MIVTNRSTPTKRLVGRAIQPAAAFRGGFSSNLSRSYSSPRDSHRGARNMRNIMTGVLAAALLPAYVFATDGQTLIDQSIVTAAGGFPYKITAPGSYKLSGNLAASGSVISITAENVTLDLNGFTLSCTSCGVNSFSLDGIDSTGASTRILNGTVMGFPGGGIVFTNN